jgi:hypothetical protein
MRAKKARLWIVFYHLQLLMQTGALLLMQTGALLLMQTGALRGILGWRAGL